jgi:hypothetical protein
MANFRYFICARDLIMIAHGDIDRVHWYIKKPKQCIDSYCQEDILEVIVQVVNNKVDGKNKSPKQNVVSDRKKRSSTR